MSDELTIRVVRALREVDPDAWNACANPGEPEEAPQGQEERFNPFLTHAFLNACETSGSAVARTGWSGAHVLVEDRAGTLLACAPAWLKSHSQGEYVFDHGWADAYERAGGRYYPKLQVCVPFTPVPGRRLLVRPGPQAEAARDALLHGLRTACAKANASSVHLTFLRRDEWASLGTQGYLQRTNKQFHFFNRGYADFDAFLASLSSRKRKVIKRERKEALEADITIEWATGADLTQAHWDALFAFYIDTGSRKWGTPYLTRAFFSTLHATLADRVLLVMAKRKGRYIAGALNLIGDDALYGRNWGCLEEHPFLHFEVCYYQAIDFALARGLKRVEAGAQGEHKLLRGYEPIETYSAHWIADARLGRAVEQFLTQERQQVSDMIDAYAEHTPFRKG